MVSTYMARIARILGGSRFKPFAQRSKDMTESDFFKSWMQPLHGKGRMQRHPRFDYHYGGDAKYPVKMENESSMGLPIAGFVGAGTKIAKTGRVRKSDLRMLRPEDATPATKNLPMGPKYTSSSGRFKGKTVRRVPDMSRDQMFSPFTVPTMEVRVGPKGYPNVSDAVYKMERSDADFMERHLSSRAWNKRFNKPSPNPRAKYIDNTNNIPQKKSSRGMPKPKTLARGVYTTKPPSRSTPPRVKGYSGPARKKVDKAHFPSEAELDRRLANKGRKYH